MKKFSSCNSIFNGKSGFELMTVETDISSGLYAFRIIGLPDRMVQESKFRIISALRNSDFGIPQRRNEKVTVSLLPAHSKKMSVYSDLSIAVAYLIASNQIDDFEDPTVLIGQLGLDGSISCPDDISHLITIAVHIALQNNIKNFVLPSNAADGIVSESEIQVATVNNLSDVRSLKFEKIRPNDRANYSNAHIAESDSAKRPFDIDSLEGIEYHKRALQIALAGKHPILFGGMPGTGKSALSRCAVELMDDLSHEQAMDVQTAYSGAQISRSESAEDFFRPPMRMPHHNATRTSLIGGATMKHIGEISLANHGILLLDELCEFGREAIESLREIFDHRGVHMRKGNHQSFISFEGTIIATTNLCPCGSALTNVDKTTGNSGPGQANRPVSECRCTKYQIRQYQSRISNPMLDRFHIKTIFHRKFAHAPNTHTAMSGSYMKKSISGAILRQKTRSGPGKLIPNAYLTVRQITELGISAEADMTIRQAEKTLGMPKRVITNIFRLARTISDLDNVDIIQNAHMLEAIQLARTNPFY